MDAELKRKWVKALRGKKYKQCTLALKKGQSFCCLGVLCDIQGAEWQGDGAGYQAPSINGREVRSRNGSEYVLPSAAGGLSRSKQRQLADMNDGRRKYGHRHSFSEIADYIEREL